MAVKLRLKRMGRHKVASYRIVAADARSPRDGRFIEEIGLYQPQSKQTQVVLNQEAALKWLKKGAQPTDTVRTILSDAGVLKALHEEKNPAKAVEEAPATKKKTVKKAD